MLFMTDVLKNHLSRNLTTFLHVYCQENLVSVPPRGRKSKIKKKKPTKPFLLDKVIERPGSREVLQTTAVRPKILIVPANSVSKTQNLIILRKRINWCRQAALWQVILKLRLHNNLTMMHLKLRRRVMMVISFLQTI
jgi:hypothetical protein